MNCREVTKKYVYKGNPSTQFYHNILQIKRVGTDEGINRFKLGYLIQLGGHRPSQSLVLSINGCSSEKPMGYPSTELASSSRTPEHWLLSPWLTYNSGAYQIDSTPVHKDLCKPLTPSYGLPVTTVTKYSLSTTYFTAFQTYLECLLNT